MPRLQLRAMRNADTEGVGEVLQEAFGREYVRRGLSAPFPNLDAAVWLASAYGALDAQGAIVAESSQGIVGCGFAHMRGRTASIGPIASSASAPSGTGRAIVSALLDLTGDRSVRLFQDAFNPGSFALYSKFGFRVVEPIAYMLADRLTVHGHTNAARIQGVGEADFHAMCSLDQAMTGADRERDLREVVAQGSGLVYKQAGQVRGYLLVRRGAHRVIAAPAVADDLEVMRDLLAEFARRNVGEAAALRVPAGPRYGGGHVMVQAALDHGFRIEHLGHLMVRGSYPVFEGSQLFAIFPESF